MSGDDAAVDEPDRTTVRRDFGYTWGETDGTIWLRNDESEYKRIDPSFVEPLEALARGERDPSAADPDVLEAIDLLAAEGYLEPGGEIQRHEPPPDIRLWPRLVAFGGTAIALGVLITARWRAIWSAPGSIRSAIPVLAFFVVATVLHELGHYAASKPYFEPSIRVGKLNGVVPALITETRDGWQCPRNVRLWISLAGPFVDVVVTLAVAIAFVRYPEFTVLGPCILVQLFRLLIVLNPLIDGDGYWLLVDVFGTHNLRHHAFRDLKRGRATPKAAFAASIIAFTGAFVVAGGYLLGRLIGLV